VSLVDREKLRANYLDLAKRLDADETAGIVRPRVRASLVEDVTGESVFEQYGLDFTFRSDEAVERGGGGQHPSPLRYFLSGVAFCEVGWYAKGSAVLDVPLKSLEIELETLLDMRGEHHVDGVAQHPQHLILTAWVDSPAPIERVLEMVDWADARCPLFSLVARAIPIYERIWLGGVQIRDTIPPGIA
jgi:uncharacterized OsmC-like protein